MCDDDEIKTRFMPMQMYMMVVVVVVVVAAGVVVVVVVVAVVASCAREKPMQPSALNSKVTRCKPYAIQPCKIKAPSRKLPPVWAAFRGSGTLNPKNAGPKPCTPTPRLGCESLKRAPSTNSLKTAEALRQGSLHQLPRSRRLPRVPLRTPVRDLIWDLSGFYGGL